MTITLLNPSCDMERIRAIWQTLSSSSETSYFLSLGWVENWLATLPDNVSVSLAVIFHEMSAPCLDGLSFIIHHFPALQIKHLSKKNTGLVNISYNTSSIIIAVCRSRPPNLSGTSPPKAPAPGKSCKISFLPMKKSSPLMTHTMFHNVIHYLGMEA